MITITTSSEKTITEFGRDLWAHVGKQAKTFEAASQACAEAVYREFLEKNGQPTFSLVRVFRLTHYVDLPSSIKQTASEKVDQWMVLMGTAGVESAWCDRRQSKGHRAIPAGSRATPMLKAVFEQIGFEAALSDDKGGLAIQEATWLTRYFHIENALNSPHIPAQDEFVKPYGIQSVVGIGSGFMSKSACLLLGFATVRIDKDSAHHFAQLTPYISTLLATYDGHSEIWERAA